MKSKVNPGLYVLLFLYVVISMGYYVAGVTALREEFFHAQRYAERPFEFRDDGRTLDSFAKRLKAPDLVAGDILLAVNGAAFRGDIQIHDLMRNSTPGTPVRVTVKTASGKVHDVRFLLSPREGPDFKFWSYVAFLFPVLGVPVFSLLVGYWVVAARPWDLNAWLVLILLTFPEVFFGNLDWSFWPAPWYLWLGLWSLGIQFFVFPVLLCFGVLFPERWRVDVRLPWLKYVFLSASFLLVLMEAGYLGGQIFAVDRIQPFVSAIDRINRIANGFALACILLFLAALFDKLRSASTADARRRMRVLAFGSGLSLGPLAILFTVPAFFGADVHHGNWFLVLIPLLSLFPLTLAYVLVVQRAMEIRILLRMGTQYLLARATVVAVEVILVAFVILRFLLPLMRRIENPVANFALLVVCIAAISQIFLRRNSLGQLVQRWVDRRFFRDAYQSEQLLSELTEQVRLLHDSTTLFDAVLGRISTALHVSRVALLLRGGSAFHLQQTVGIEPLGPVVLTEGSVTIQNLERTNQPATLYPDRPEPWFTEAGSEERASLRTMDAEVLLPVAGRSRLLGLIALGPKRSEEPYSAADLRTLQSVAAQTGLSLEVGNLARELAGQAAQQERMNREMEIAREVQQRLFPQNIPQVPGVDLAGVCRPASEVGGDYYDLIVMENGHLGFAVGDVSGKGISAALIMASLRASLRGLVLDDPGDLSRVMQKVNRLVYESSSSSRYATFFFAALDPQTGTFRYVNAGHNPPVLIRQGSGEVYRLEACGPVVGMLPSTEYEARSMTLRPGDLLIGYTDGISEAMTVEDEEWGEERMIAAVPQGNASAAEVVEAISRAADAFTAGAKQHDDMTLLVMKIT